MAEPRPIGRPRQFDTEQVLDAALETFRTRGYAGTSLDDLTAATGLNRPSLYGAFGNKQALFEACVEHYWRTTGRGFVAALNSTGELRRDLRAFFAAILDQVCGRGSSGCVVACALPAEVEREPSLRPRLESLLKDSDTAVAARLARAKRGELRPGLDPDRLAEIIVGTTLSLSLRARAGAPRPRLEALAEEAVNVACAPGRTRRKQPPRRGRGATA